MRYFSLIVCFSALTSHAADKPSGVQEQALRNIGRVTFVQGNVVVDGKQVKDDAPVREGTLVEVGNGKCTLLLGRDTVFQLARKARVKVTQYGIEQMGEAKLASKNESAAIDILGGKLRALVRDTGRTKKDYKIRGAGVVMGVRGTQVYFEVEQNGGAKVLAIEGKVEITSANAGEGAKPVELKAGQSASIAAPGSAAAAQAGSGVQSAGGAVVNVATADTKTMEAATKDMALPFAAEQGPPGEGAMFGPDLGSAPDFDIPQPGEFTDPSFNDAVEVGITFTATVGN
jgi:hypothetical protein